MNPEHRAVVGISLYSMNFSQVELRRRLRVS